MSIFSFSFIPRAFAQGLPPGYTDKVTVAPQQSGYYVSSLGTLFTSVFAWAAGFGGLIVLAYLIWGGIEWLTAGGDKSKTEAGRTKITQSIIGFALLAVVFVIYSLVTSFLGLKEKVNVGI